MRALQLKREQPPMSSPPTCGARFRDRHRQRQGVRDPGDRARGPYELAGDPSIMQLLDELLAPSSRSGACAAGSTYRGLSAGCVTPTRVTSSARARLHNACGPHTLSGATRDVSQRSGGRHAVTSSAARTANAVRCESNQSELLHELERQGRDDAPGHSANRRSPRHSARRQGRTRTQTGWIACSARVRARLPSPATSTLVELQELGGSGARFLAGDDHAAQRRQPRIAVSAGLNHPRRSAV